MRLSNQARMLLRWRISVAATCSSDRDSNVWPTGLVVSPHVM